VRRQGDKAFKICDISNGRGDGDKSVFLQLLRLKKLRDKVKNLVFYLDFLR